MKKNSKESENNSQKQTGKKSVGTPTESGGKPNHKIKDGVYPGVAVKTQKLLDAEKEHMLNQLEKDTKAVIDLTDGYARKVMDADRKMRKVEKNTTLLPGTTIHHIPFPEAFAIRGSGCEMDDDGDGNCAIHPKGCPDVAKYIGGTDPIESENLLATEIKKSGRVVVLDGKDLERVKIRDQYPLSMDEVFKLEESTITTTLEAAAVENLEVEFEEVDPATVDMEDVEFFYKPDSFEKVMIGEKAQFACQDGDQVIYIPCEHSSDEGIGITMPMWLAELKHLV